MTKWEYTRTVHTFYKLSEMNELGKEGWELIAMLDGYCYFKRPIVETKDNHESKSDKAIILDYLNDRNALYK